MWSSLLLGILHSNSTAIGHFVENPGTDRGVADSHLIFTPLFSLIIGKTAPCCIPFMFLARNVGFLKYFQFQQIPNFLVASPMIILCISGISTFIQSLITATREKPKARGKGTTGEQKALIPHFGLLAFLTIYTLLMVHVQIIARLFSFQPSVYWILADLYSKSSPLTRRVIAGYSLSCTVIGSILFMNFYPPA